MLGSPVLGRKEIWRTMIGSQRSKRALVFTPPPDVHVGVSWIVPPNSLRLPPLAWSASHGRIRGTAAAAQNDDSDNVRLRVLRIKGDGRCLYRSIARVIAHAEGRSLSDKLEREDADALRSIAWKAMCVDRRKEFEHRNIVEGSIAAYCSQMRNPTFFAGEAEMLALSDALRLPIAVFLQDQRGKFRNIMTYGEKYASLRKTGPKLVRVLYNGSNHYNAVVPA